MNVKINEKSMRIFFNVPQNVPVLRGTFYPAAWDYYNE